MSMGESSESERARTGGGRSRRRRRSLLVIGLLAAAACGATEAPEATVSPTADGPVVQVRLALGDQVVEIALPPAAEDPPDAPGDDGAPGTGEDPAGDDASRDEEGGDEQGGDEQGGDAGEGAAADGATFAPVDRPGPELSVDRAALDASLRCPAALGEVGRPVVLLIPGTTVTPQEAFGWNYAPAFEAQGIPYCMVTVPQFTNGDIQVAAEYVVDAVRTIHAATDRQVILLGWSQGASTLPRWALRFWPDIRPMVSDLIGLAPLNNRGSVVAGAICIPGACIPAGWQQATGSAFMEALNSGAQTFDGIDYTVLYSRTDEVVTPNVDGALSVLPEGPNVTNVALSDVCPTDLSEHLTIVASPTAWAFALDAIEHPGPANLDRVEAPGLCLPGLMPEVSPIALLTEELRMVANVGVRLLQGQVPAEPPLADYVFAR